MLRRNFTYLLFMTYLFVGNIPSAVADDADLLKQPRYHLIMRHAIAPGTGDPSGFELADCSTQRNLSDRGRIQAQGIGKAIISKGITIDEVYSSQWCRCLDTAELLDLGDVQPLPSLNSVWTVTEEVKQQRTKEFLEFLQNYPADKTAMFVTHYANIHALTGDAIGSGDVLILKVTKDSVSIVKEFNAPAVNP